MGVDCSSDMNNRIVEILEANELKAWGLDGSDFNPREAIRDVAIMIGGEIESLCRRVEELESLARKEV